MLVLAACGEDLFLHRDADGNSLCDKCGEAYTDGREIRMLITPNIFIRFPNAN